MAGIGGILGNPILEQILLYNVVGQLISSALTPYSIAISNSLNSLTPLLPLSPAEAAEATLRNIDVPGGAAHEASMGGISAERFAVMTQLAGNAPDPGSLAVALRRELIDNAQYVKGIRQGRLRDEWADLIRELAVVQPPPNAMLAALLEGQIPEGEARDKYAKLGGDPDYFDILLHTEGQAPTPVQALEMANRGIIPFGGSGPNAVSFEQAFLEGPWRNKWLPAFRKLGEYLPPPRTVTAMYHEGAISAGEATALLEKQGLTHDLASAYLVSSSKSRTAKSRDLAQSTILALYRDRIIPRAEARSLLETLGYEGPEADYVLEIEDLRLTQQAITHAVARVHTLYVGHKIDSAQAAEALAQLGVDATGAGDLLSVWEHERAANVRQLTPADIVAAVKLDLLAEPDALAMLVDHGYTDHDAWLYLSVHLKAAQPGEPAA